MQTSNNFTVIKKSQIHAAATASLKIAFKICTCSLHDEQFVANLKISLHRIE